MKTHIRYLLGAIFATLFLVAVPVAAETSTNSTTPGPSPSTNSTTKSSETNQNQPETEADKTARASRLEKLKTEMKINLSKADQDRLKARCKASQGIIQSLKSRTKEIEKNRSVSYAELNSQLIKLIAKLDAKDVNTTTLKQEQVALDAKITTFLTDLASYQQNVADIAAMDCASDPAAFKAALEKARTLLTKLKQDAADIRSYVNDTIKKTLEEIRKQLGAKESQEKKQ